MKKSCENCSRGDTCSISYCGEFKQMWRSKTGWCINCLDYLRCNNIVTEGNAHHRPCTDYRPRPFLARVREWLNAEYQTCNGKVLGLVIGLVICAFGIGMCIVLLLAAIFGTRG